MCSGILSWLLATAPEADFAPTDAVLLVTKSAALVGVALPDKLGARDWAAAAAAAAAARSLLSVV